MPQKQEDTTIYPVTTSGLYPTVSGKIVRVAWVDGQPRVMASYKSWAEAWERDEKIGHDNY